MATEIFYFEGTAKWAKVNRPDKEYGHYSIDLYMDKDALAAFKESGCRVELKTDDEGTYARFRRNPANLFDDQPEKPKLLTIIGGEDLDSFEYQPLEGNIGNGSKVIVKVAVFQTKKGKGHRLEAVAVKELVPYSDNAGLPF